MIKNKETIKTYFETGDKPTQEQYMDLIDSYIDAKQPEGKPNRQFAIDEKGEVAVVEQQPIPVYSLSEVANNKLSLLKDGVVVKEITLPAASGANGNLHEVSSVGNETSNDLIMRRVAFKPMPSAGGINGVTACAGYTESAASKGFFFNPKGTSQPYIITSNFTNIHTLKLENRVGKGSTGTFAFVEDLTEQLSTKHIEVQANGGGIVLKSPDGNTTKKITIDNAGNLVLV